MTPLTQEDRRFRLKTSSPTDGLLVHRLRGEEAVSTLFRFEIDLLAPSETEIPFDQLLGEPATLKIATTSRQPRYVNGIIAEFSQGDPGTQWTPYRAVLVPKLWLLTKDLRSRVFQQKTVVDIVQRVLEEAEIEVDVRLRDTYVVRNYCVQHHESTFHFIQRILEESGIFYTWQHNEHSHRLALMDHMESVPAVDPGPWHFHPTSGGTRKEESIGSWQRHQEVVPGKYGVRDLAFQLREQLVSSVTPIIEQVTVGQNQQRLLLNANRNVEVNEHNPEFAEWFDDVGPLGEDQSEKMSAVFAEGKRVAQLAMERYASSSIWIEGASDISSLSPGCLIKTKNTPGGDGVFFLTAVFHEGRQPVSATDGDEETSTYFNRFRCQPSSLAFRPKITATKPDAGPEAAVVLGPREGHPYVDKHGRVRVRFHWSDAPGENQSCWMRVGQPWAGNRRGFNQLPRAGDEVVVNFYEHDPDRPYVDNSMHNAKNVLTRDMPLNKHQTIFRSAGLDDSAEYTGIAMDDRVSHLQLFSSGDMSQSLGGNFYHNTAGHHQMNIGGSQARYVGGPIWKEVNPNAEQSTESRTIRKSSTGPCESQRVQEHIKQHLQAHQHHPRHHGQRRGNIGSGSGSEGGPTAWPANGSSTIDEFAHDVELVWGLSQEGTVGVDDEEYLGIMNESVINPIGFSFIGSMVADGSTTYLADASGWGMASALLGVPVQGQVDNIFGSFSFGCYGPVIRACHGPVTVFCPGSGILYQQSALARACAIFALLTVVANIFQRVCQYFLDHSEGQNYTPKHLGFAMLFELAKLEMENIWYLLEETCYFTKEAASQKKTFEGLMNRILTLFTVSVRDIVDFFTTNVDYYLCAIMGSLVAMVAIAIILPVALGEL